MKRKILTMALVLLTSCIVFVAAHAESYTHFCDVNAQFEWLESVAARVEPYASSSTNGVNVNEGSVVTVNRLVKNQYGNLWAELSSGGFVCFFDCGTDKKCGEFVSFVSGTSPVTASGVSAPEGEIEQGSSFTWAGRIKSSVGCPIYYADVWVTNEDGIHQFEDFIECANTELTTQLDLNELGINTLYPLSQLVPGEYQYSVRIRMGFTYDSVSFIFDSGFHYPIQTEFTVVEKKTAYTVPSGSLSTKLTYLRKVFPEGRYWNHWSDSDLGTYTQESFTINGHATTISNKPCTSSTHNKTGSCNHYWGSYGGIQCTGFARMMFEVIWNMDTEYASYGFRYLPDTDNADCLDYVEPGDMIWTGGHMMLVTAVNGNTFTVVHCNVDGQCGISWDDTRTKEWVHSKMKGNGTGYIASADPIVLSDSDVSWVKYKTVCSSLSVWKWPSKSTGKAGTMYTDEVFYIDENHQYTKSGVIFAYGKSESGLYGWIQINNEEYCVPVEDDTEEPDSSGDSNITFSAGSDLKGTAGSTIVVPVSIQNPDAVALGVISLKFDLPAGVTVSNVVACESASGASVVLGNPTLVSEMTSGITGSGKILEVTLAFDSSADFPAIVTITPTINTLSPEEEYELSSFVATVEDGAGRIPGDVTSDGKVSTADFLRLGKYLAGWENTTIHFSNADVTGDGKVSTADFLRLGKYLAGWGVVLE